jgi:anti-sigma regulatory factor (Ser/Thr protein kinase)
VAHCLALFIGQRRGTLVIDLTQDRAQQAAHAALLYASTDEFVTGALGFVDEGLDKDEPVLVSAPGQEISLLRARMNGRSDEVSWTDITQVGVNPGRIIPHLHAFASAHAGRPVRCLQELGWSARSAAEQSEAIRHEALINLAFAAVSVRILCAYDSVRLDPVIIRSAMTTHPVFRREGRAGSSPAYDTDAVFPDEWDQSLPRPPDGAATLAYRADLAAVRAYAARQASALGLPADRVLDLVLAVGELTANTFCHTDAGGQLSIWTAGNELLCQVEDTGHITDPLAGRRQPAPDAGSGHGLWTVHQVCDLVELRSDAGGTVARLHMRLAR